MYTPELREYIAMKYSEDISRFNYKFDIYNWLDFYNALYIGDTIWKTYWSISFP
jgi:hypothetical protein